MANSFIEYTGDGSTTAFSITFNYLATTDVKAFLNGTPTTTFSVNGQTLTFNSAPASQTAILIERDTPKTSRLVDFSDGAILSEADLDKNSNQLFFISQEAVDTADRALGLDNSNQFDATKNSVARRITNLADPVNAQDAVTKNWLTTTYLTPANIVNIDATGTNIANVNTVAGDIANVNSVAGNATNINTVAGNNANINTVAGNNTAISTVAGISSQVTTVANASTNIAAVATDIAAVQTVASDLQETVSEIETVANDLNEQTSEIDTVAGAVANINTVGTNINNVNATGGAITNVNTVAGQISPTNNLGTVAGISTEIGNVSGISSAVSSVSGAITNVNAVAGQISPTNNISTVASNISDIQDVGGNIGAITTVNGISANVSTVAGISSDVTSAASNSTNITNVANNASNITTVAGAATNINTVAANVTNVGTVANISSDVTTVAGDSTDIGTVAGAIANVNSVATNSANINAVAANSTNINSVAGNASNINTVSGISSDVSTVASNVTGVNSFADRYRVGSSDPSSSNDAGDLFFNTSASALKFYNGTQWNQITTFSGNYNDLTNKPTIPAAPAIEDNSGTPALATGITAAEVRTAIGAGTSDLQLGTTATTALAGNTVIPTNTNQLTNGASFITSADGGNAATLDGIDSSSFLRSDANDTTTGYFTVDNHFKVINDSVSGQGDNNTHFNYDRGGVNYIRGSNTIFSGQVSVANNIKFGDGVSLMESTDRSDLLQITSSTSGWAGLQIRNSSNEGRWSFMTDGSAAGLYDDENGDWHIHMTENSGVNLYHNGSAKLATSSSGVSVTGSMTASGNVTAYSDQRLKDNIETLDGSKVYEMRGVSFTKDGRANSGVIAQELQNIAPELVQDDGEYLSVAYGNVVGYLIEAIKELKAEVEVLKNASSN